MDTERQRSSTFSRVFNAASRARQELANPDDFLTATRRLFRRRPRIQGSLGRRTNPVWKARLFLLPGPNLEVLPSAADLQHLTANGLGKPAKESLVEEDTCKIELDWTLSELNNFICQCYPLMSLNLTGFELARVGKGRKLQKLRAGSVKELKKSVGKSRLYILPRVDITQITPVTGTSSEHMDSPFTHETSQMIEEVPDQDLPQLHESIIEPSHSAVLITETCEETRQIRFEQDQEYRNSLLADQQKAMRRQALENVEERRRMVIKERSERMANREEPLNGISLKFKYPDGSVKIGKFTESEPIQVLFDFVGQVEVASEVFKLQEAFSGQAIESTSTGLILEQGITANSTLYVLWMSSLDVEEYIANQVDAEQPNWTSSALSWELPVPSASNSSPDPGVAAYMQSTEHTAILIDDDDDVCEVTVSSALQPPLSNLLQEESVNDISLQTVLSKLVDGVDFSHCPTSNQINVCRANILQCSLQAFQRRRFNPEAKLDVVFADEDMTAEGAVDEGGPTREFLRLLMKAINGCKIFEGHENSRQLALNTEALETKMYMWVARMISVCVVHGGVGPHFFSERLFQHICGLPIAPARLEDIGDHTLREQLMKIKEAQTVLEANVAVQEAADCLSILGCLRQVTKMEDKDTLVCSAVDFLMNGRLRDATDQFMEGLKTLGLLGELQNYPGVFYDMFVCQEKPLTARDMSSLFTVDFSRQGSNQRALENQTVCFWRDWLIDVEEGDGGPITLKAILEFASGASAVPPLGFPHQPQISFLHEHSKIFPEANTCLLILSLPMHPSYDMFKKYMTEGILQAPTFGVA